MPVTSSKPVAGGLKGVTLPDDPDHVVLPVVLRAPATSTASRRRPAIREVGIVMQPRQWRQGSVPRSTPRRRSCPITTTISARPIRFPSSTTSPARASRNSSARWRIGARSSPSNASLLDDPAITSEGERQAIFRRRSARNGAPMVRRPRHHGVVGRSLAQRRLRQLDGDQGHAPFPSRMGRRLRQRRRARRARWARTSFDIDPSHRPENPHGRTDQPGIRHDHL